MKDSLSFLNFSSTFSCMVYKTLISQDVQRRYMMKSNHLSESFSLKTVIKLKWVIVWENFPCKFVYWCLSHVINCFILILPLKGENKMLGWFLKYNIKHIKLYLDSKLLHRILFLLLTCGTTDSETTDKGRLLYSNFPKWISSQQILIIMSMSKRCK